MPAMSGTSSINKGQQYYQGKYGRAEVIASRPHLVQWARENG